MKVPPHKNIFATPLANCWIDGAVLCIDNLNCERSIFNTEVHYRTIFASYNETKYWLKEFPVCEPFSGRVRKLMAEMMSGRCSALAIVSPDSNRKSMEISFRETMVAGVATRIFVNEPEARRWLGDMKIRSGQNLR